MDSAERKYCDIISTDCLTEMLKSYVIKKIYFYTTINIEIISKYA